MTPSELKKWRIRHEYTQAELGKMLGVTKTTVYRWEKTMRVIPPFLHLALRCLEIEGGEFRRKGKTHKRKEVKR